MLTVLAHFLTTTFSRSFSRSCASLLTPLGYLRHVGCGLLLVAFLLSNSAAAQNTISGNITDGAAPIGWANVVLFGADGKLVAATVSTEAGSFALTAAHGTYKLRVSFLGFTDWEQDVPLSKSLTIAPIVLQPSTASLQEVVVVGRKKLVEYQTDRVVFNVENSVAAVGGDAVGALAAAPGVLVRNGSISMLGKGSARVMVNGRLLELSGEELVAYLKSIPASSIRNVEVITNPPAQYEASGDGGLLNINLKQGPTNAWQNTTTLAYEQNSFGAATLQNNLVYSKDKLRLTLSASGKQGNTRVKQRLDTYYPAGSWELRYAARQQTGTAAGQLALDYDLTQHTTIGLQYAGSSTSAPSSQDHTRIGLFNPAHTLDSVLMITGTRLVRTNSHAANAHVVTVLDTLQRRISLDADYFSYCSEVDNRFASASFSPAQEFLNPNLAAQNISGQQIQNFSGKVDVEHPLKWARLSYGAKVSLIQSRSALQYYNTRPARPILDPSQSNSFEYREQTQALYLSGTRRLSTHWNLQLGLRLEQTQTRGYSATLDQRTTNDYLKAFPSAYLTYQPSENQQMQATYGRRVNRPGFALLNPFRSYINSTSYSEGNPFLQPSFVDNLELTHTFREALRTTAFLSRTTDGFGPVFTANPTTNTLVISRQNYFRELAFGLGTTYSATPTSWWQTHNTLYLLGSRSRFTGALAAVPRNTPQLYAATSHTFTLSPTTKLQADYTYSSPVTRGLYTTGYLAGLNLAWQQRLFRNRVQATLLLNDVFNTAYLKDYTSTVNGVKQVYSENNSSRFVRLSLSYDFGNRQLKVAPREFGNDAEQRRTN
ncbi:outer membrane beta-barrel family protein [Hymenobacter cellulosivorans]|uniref:TonB-dependent receptor n=1 Tax=Hymenobacter cellulosivorans TaxID=2932249 RepID=A0ABY4F6A6_9BACT|nr:outer membrane beta-barrel family protein [Hymenobacter cellulosivorans]UOQ51542.1 TonB-dependent receptor [Hymenobacter cellulosivorans]